MVTITTLNAGAPAIVDITLVNDESAGRVYRMVIEDMWLHIDNRDIDHGELRYEIAATKLDEFFWYNSPTMRLTMRREIQEQ